MRWCDQDTDDVLCGGEIRLTSWSAAYEVVMAAYFIGILSGYGQTRLRKIRKYRPRWKYEQPTIMGRPNQSLWAHHAGVRVMWSLGKELDLVSRSRHSVRSIQHARWHGEEELIKGSSQTERTSIVPVCHFQPSGLAGLFATNSD